MSNSMLMDYVISFGVWNWFIAAGIFFTIELLAPGAFMLWFGLAALLVGIISQFVVWPWQYQIIAFAVFALVSIPLWRRVARGIETPDDQPFLNRRADAYVGREFTLDKPIAGGIGTVKIDDSIWRLAGPDCSAGSRVKVVRADSATLVVEPV